MSFVVTHRKYVQLREEAAKALWQAAWSLDGPLGTRLMTLVEGPVAVIYGMAEQLLDKAGVKLDSREATR